MLESHEDSIVGHLRLTGSDSISQKPFHRLLSSAVAGAEVSSGKAWKPRVISKEQPDSATRLRLERSAITHYRPG